MHVRNVLRMHRGIPQRIYRATEAGRRLVHRLGQLCMAVQVGHVARRVLTVAPTLRLREVLRSLASAAPSALGATHGRVRERGPGRLPIDPAKGLEPAGVETMDFDALDPRHSFPRTWSSASQGRNTIDLGGAGSRFEGAFDGAADVAERGNDARGAAGSARPPGTSPWGRPKARSLPIEDHAPRAQALRAGLDSRRARNRTIGEGVEMGRRRC
jgi:hypothetical protein